MTGRGFILLGERLRDELARHEAIPPTSEARSRRQLLLRVARSKPQRSKTLVLGAGVVAVAAASFLLITRPRAEPPLSFWIDDRSGQVDEWVTARSSERSLRFSDGSSIVAAPHTTTRVMRVAPGGAELTLERGQLQAHVVHREAARWRVAAGPFVVRVTGTRFRVGWDPQTEKLAVSVSEGRVEVTGAGQPPHELVAGSTLQLSAGAGSELKSALVQPEAPSPAPSVTPLEPTGEDARDEDEALKPRKSVEHKPDFRELSTAGRYREALALVEQQGFESQCDSLSARDLLTLAGTARLAGRADRAQAAYSAVRRRFPSGAEAGISAFSLGRLASDAGRTGDAMAWFRRYLSEQPSGALAREAAGRLLELLHESGDVTRAREAATRYLKRYPSGPHAALAQTVLANR